MNRHIIVKQNYCARASFECIEFECLNGNYITLLCRVYYLFNLVIFLFHFSYLSNFILCSMRGYISDEIEIFSSGNEVYERDKSAIF